ncbi:Hsp20/alpha crystallin family protein [Actinoplanes sp. KI2]|uniref:Hsp20/alpha crystallin family protein n=1 Tax=Actinoplanes sp. KI2 TaxID=2983315 RepID=UPI0021D5B752|nr:Hsp20/alpha crystallin family protein [Actinoplanes sp. KI2]MCU7729437.1 Hsp20/alpha crystallin family protein [Actinoplanes sp. KI2]
MISLLPRVFGDMNDWFGADFPRDGRPIRFEDRLTDTEYVLRAELPGIDPGKDLEVTVDHGVLTMRAERREEYEGMNRSEFHYGTLQRAVRMPGNADEEHISAAYRSGILEVTVPLKAAESTSRQIPISEKE